MDGCYWKITWQVEEDTHFYFHAVIDMRNMSLKQFSGESDWSTTRGRMVQWIFIQYQGRSSITWTGECLEVGRAICLLLWWEEGTELLDVYIHICVHPTRTAELSNCLFSMQGPGGLQLSLTTIPDFSFPNLCCKVLSWARKHSLEPVQNFCQQQQQSVLSALGRELARGQGCSSLSSAPSCNVWSEFKVGQNAFASVNMSFLLFFCIARMWFYIKDIASLVHSCYNQLLPLHKDLGRFIRNHPQTLV